MAKKVAGAKKAGAADDTAQPMRICFERIIPDEMDPERPIRRALRTEMAGKAGGRLSAADTLHLSRMAVVVSKKWEKGQTLKCRFLDGSPKMRKQVEKFAHQWEKHAGIKFKFVSVGVADIRVSFFADAGSWSAVGRDALNRTYFPLHQPTMNYGWLRDNTGLDEYSRVVLHEFGHALGCIHEHQSPTFSRVWNVPAVMKAFQGAPNFWSAADIQHNVLGKYSNQGIKATQFDAKSIMLYSFDGSLFSDGLGPTNSNTVVSPTDIKHIKAVYP